MVPLGLIKILDGLTKNEIIFILRKLSSSPDLKDQASEDSLKACGLLTADGKVSWVSGDTPSIRITKVNSKVVKSAQDSELLTEKLQTLRPELKDLLEWYLQNFRDNKIPINHRTSLNWIEEMESLEKSYLGFQSAVTAAWNKKIGNPKYIKAILDNPANAQT